MPVGGACGLGAFGVCNSKAGLTCSPDGVCVAGTPAALGEACDFRHRLNGPCDEGPVGNRSGNMACRPGGGAGDTERLCYFICDDGDGCGGAFDLCPRGRIMDGVCVEGRVKGDPCNHPTAECSTARGHTCRPNDGNGGGTGSNVRLRPGVCAVLGAVGAACDAATGDQCIDGTACVAGVCVDRAVGLGGACMGDGDCARTPDGEVTGCWRGRGAGGKTCRAWVGPYQPCASADTKCWAPALRCADEAGGASVCGSATGGEELGAYCRLDGDDCTGTEGLFCATSPSTPDAVCKRYVAEGERCDPPQGKNLLLCNPAEGLECRYVGRWSSPGPGGNRCRQIQ